MKRPAIAIRLSSTLALVHSVACASAQGTPTSLRPDVVVEHYMDVRSSASRVAYDAVTDHLYYLRTTGDVLMVIDNGNDAPYDTVLYTAADHLLDEAFGMAFHDSDLFVIGNSVDGVTTQGTLHRAHLLPDGQRSWSVVARTEPYAWGGKAHGFNNVVVSPDGQYLYLNCGSRTDHGEVQDVSGAFPGLREEPITAKILRVPVDAQDLILPNDEDELLTAGYIFAFGVRNTFDMAFDAEGRLFGVENSGDHDDPEEMNWLREEHHYGFPWTAGGNPNPTRFSGYDPLNDNLLNPGYPSAATDFYFDSTFPPTPWTTPTEPIRNNGPDADRLRDPLTGGMQDASDGALNMSTFTCHRSPLGLVFDTDSVLGNDLQGDGFVLSFTPGGDTLGFSPIAPWGIPVVPADPSEDLLQLELSYDEISETFTTSATRIVEGFYLPVDAELVGHTLYVIENWGGTQRSLWKVTMPLENGLEEVDAPTAHRLTVWPIPATEELRWSVGVMPQRLDLLDANGRTVLVVDPVVTFGAIPLSALAPGMYFLKATFQEGSISRRVPVLR